MDEKSVFFEVEALRADRARPVLSAAALEVHVRVVDHLAHTTGAAFIADEILDTLAHGRVTTMAAIELWLAGWWRRLDGGYVIVDQELIDALSHSPALRRLGAACRRLWKTLNSETVIPL
ncbi:hypothetical protein [Mycolicibacterium sp. 050158]|jgi:hypothetical protein|uniref:hypothetical protein n=1 Tax=Mycolicibacterium sp. 050158 TaxID=3090602 RepID=UPI00299E91F3|nr:hypothetical protein [Mycolicibacterium sp. 050158]MDX1892163.1 hypothetical protein [Mycolicibacterium sp. 050158]